METLIKIFLFLFVFNATGAQSTSIKNIAHLDNNQDVEINTVLWVSSRFHISAKPTFVGLFQKDFNQSLMVIKWQHIYNDYNAGLKVSFHKNLGRRFLLQLNYQWGLLKFNNQIVGEASGYSTRLSLKYNF